jgi:hypothetical protein
MRTARLGVLLQKRGYTDVEVGVTEDGKTIYSTFPLWGTVYRLTHKRAPVDVILDHDRIPDAPWEDEDVAFRVEDARLAREAEEELERQRAVRAAWKAKQEKEEAERAEVRKKLDRKRAERVQDCFEAHDGQHPWTMALPEGGVLITCRLCSAVYEPDVEFIEDWRDYIDSDAIPVRVWIEGADDEVYVRIAPAGKAHQHAIHYYPDGSHKCLVPTCTLDHDPHCGHTCQHRHFTDSMTPLPKPRPGEDYDLLALLPIKDPWLDDTPRDDPDENAPSLDEVFPPL